MKKKAEEKEKKPHLVRKGIAIFLALVLVLITMTISSLMTTYAPVIDGFLGAPKANVTEEKVASTEEKAEALGYQIESEGIVLVKNDGGTLPLSESTTKVNVFGWASTAWLGGGSGSGGVSSVDVDLLQALSDYGIEYNTELTDMYKDFQDGREYTSTLNSWPEQSARLYEPSVSDEEYYTPEMLADAKAFSDTAIMVIGRLAGESNDATKVQYRINKKDGEVIADESRTELELSPEEEELLTYLGENYENVVVLINSGNVMELGQIETIPGVDACLLVGMTGQMSASAIPAVLCGEVNPSGRTADTWAYDLSTAPSYANAGLEGVGAYTDAEGMYPADGTTNGNLGETFEYDQVSYVDYAEGIYVGYRWYETADAEGYWEGFSNEYGTGYDGVVQYPFGYGLSYTTFSEKVKEAPAEKLEPDGTVSMTVTVTNTGETAGMDVVEAYFGAPYIEGEIEKSSVELAAYAKTSLLQPGESEDVVLSWNVSDMASYDCYDANNNGFAGYELDPGTYEISLREDAHEVIEEFSCTLAKNAQYPTDSVTGAEVKNRFTGEDAVDGVSLDGSDSEQNIVYLSRADFAGTFPENVVASRPMTDNLKELNLYTAEMADAWIDETDEDITTGAYNHLTIENKNGTTEVGFQLGADYDDPQWEKLLDEMTVSEMEKLYINGYGTTMKVSTISKMTGRDADGPSQIGGFTGMGAGFGYPSASTLAQTWNTELAEQMGLTVGQQALENDYTGWYAPATNIHRSPFNGRNFEYYSEDALLSGTMCGNVVHGANEAGVYTYVKHFICNDGESGIYRDGVYTWMTEQTLREIYLEPFRMITEEYDAVGLMSSYNRIGAVWAGGSTALLTDVLREEWGFHGAVITDYCDHQAYMNGDQALRAGGSLWMSGFLGGELTCETESNSYKQALREAAHQVLYMYLHVRVTNRDYVEEMGDSTLLRPSFTPVSFGWRQIVTAIKVTALLVFAITVVRFIFTIAEMKNDKKKPKGIPKFLKKD